MSHNNSHKALCTQVERKLSPFIDGELEELERLGLERHLESCAACRRELELLAEASGLLREEGRSVRRTAPVGGGAAHARGIGQAEIDLEEVARLRSCDCRLDRVVAPVTPDQKNLE